MLSPKLINFFIFQFGWIVLIYNHNFLSGLIGLVLTGVNYWLTRSSAKEVMLGLGVSFFGILNDFIIVKLGILNFSHATILPIPLWLISVWLLFVSTFSSSLLWLKRVNIFFLALLGGLGGAFSYCAGEKLNAIFYHYSGLPQFIFHGLNWFLLFPFLFTLYHRVRSRLDPNRR